MVPRRRRKTQSDRNGTVMVLFVMLTVVILGTIGLVIEMGMVRATRERMQSGADSAALEILRERDYSPAGESYPDDKTRDHARRERNRHIAAWPFADEILPEYTEESVEGPGLYIKMSSVFGAMDNEINRGLVIEEVGEGIPTLRTNYSGILGTDSETLNEKRGDIVAGSFTGHESASAVGFGDNPMIRENGDYDRVDFELPANIEDTPYADAVLVRLRKTKPYGFEGQSPWSDDIPDVSSSGYTLPLIFGLGSTFLGAEPGEGYSIRHHGVPMRATSIAEARPAVRIGVADDSLGPEWSVGAGPLAIRFAFWNNDVAFAVDANGEISAEVRLRPNYELESLTDSELIGYLYPKQATQVGDEVVPDELQPTGGSVDANLDSSFWAVGECYVPLYLFRVGNPTTIRERFICGYARVFIEELPIPAGETEEDVQFFRVTKLRNLSSPGKPWMAPRNASATFDGTQTSDVFPLTGFTDWDDLVERLFELPQPSEGVHHVPDARLYAPAHVR